ncbi:MAG TPA: alpha-1,4-glucan--maltose-1-phosphate maltosyltransferase, partial [Bryobacteraceae bacterium]|nr:alpha-1,4-glucan--maltose-1-phosphate maltosyltransferase [Bryobacteraceae bacterium]
QSPDGENLVVIVVNLDPRHKHAGYLTLPLDQYEVDPRRTFQAHDLLTGARYLWNGPRNYVELDPDSAPAHIFVIRRRLRSEHEFEYFL